MRLKGQEHITAISRAERIGTAVAKVFTRNVVLTGSLLLAPIVAMGITLKYGVVMTLMFTFIMLPASAVLCLLKERIAKPFELLTFSVICGALYIPVALAIYSLFPEEAANMGLYLSVIAVAPALYFSFQPKAEGRDRVKLFFRSLRPIFGFAFAACLISLIREVLGGGTVWGIPVPFEFEMSMINLPAAGFILIGLLAAVVKYVEDLFQRVRSWNSKGKRGA